HRQGSLRFRGQAEQVPYLTLVTLLTDIPLTIFPPVQRESGAEQRLASKLVSDRFPNSVKHASVVEEYAPPAHNAKHGLATLPAAAQIPIPFHNLARFRAQHPQNRRKSPVDRFYLLRVDRRTAVVAANAVTALPECALKAGRRAVQDHEGIWWHPCRYSDF